MIRILSIDGGGIRGLIPALVLEHLESLTGRKVAETFDLIAGSSTGGIMALLLTRPGPGGRPLYSAGDVAGLYTQHGKDLFFAPPDYAARSQNGWVLPKYPVESVRGTLSTYFEDTRVSEALAEVLVTAYDVDERMPFFFSRSEARQTPSRDYRMLDAAQATSAFPALFPAAAVTDVAGAATHHLIDGGVVEANPAGLGLARAMRVHGKEERFVVVSLGTGHYEAPLPFDAVSQWGLQQWAPRLVDVLFDGSNHGVDCTLREILRASTYYRFQVDLPAANDGTDDISPDNLAALNRIVQDAITGEVVPSTSEHESVPWPQRFAELVPLLKSGRA